MPPKTNTWDDLKWKHILLTPGGGTLLVPVPDQACGHLEVVYTLGDRSDPTARRDVSLVMGRDHPLLAKTIAQAITSTSPRLSVVDALAALLMLDIKQREGL